MNVLPTIKAQIHAAEVDLRNYRPELVNWHARAMSLVENLIPWLIEVGPAIKKLRTGCTQRTDDASRAVADDSGICQPAERAD